MGYMCHHTIVVTSWHEESIDEAHTKAEKIFGESVSKIVEGCINSQYSFFIAPDGSKEGWPESDEGDERRESFIAWMTSHTGPLYVDWVELQFGDDYHHTYILRDSDHWPEEES